MKAGVWLVAVAALLFAGKGIVIKYLYSLNVSVDQVMLLRMAFAAPIYLLIALYSWPANGHKLNLRNLGGICIVGALGYYLASYLDLYGLQYTSAALERIILYTYPVFVLIFSAWLLRQPSSPQLWLCVLIIYVGLMMVVVADVQHNPDLPLGQTIYGSVFVLLSAISFAFYVIGSSHYMQRFSSGFFTALAMLAAGLCMVIHYGVSQPFGELLGLAWPVYGWSAVNALAFTVLPTLLMSIGIRSIGASRAGAVGMVGPLGTVFIAALVLGEGVSPLQIAGFVLVLLGVHRLQRS